MTNVVLVPGAIGFDILTLFLINLEFDSNLTKLSKVDARQLSVIVLLILILICNFVVRVGGWVDG